MLTSPPLGWRYTVNARNANAPGILEELSITRRPAADEHLPSINDAAAPDIDIASCANPSILKPVPSNAASPGDATLTRLTRPPVPGQAKSGALPFAAPMFTAPPTNEMVLPSDGHAVNAALGLFHNVDLAAGAWLRKPKAEGALP